MRRAARTDANHAEVMAALRAIGCSVADLSAVGKGVPDLAVSRNGITVLVEVKNGALPPSDRRLTTAQEKFKATWRGLYFVVNSVDEAIAAVQAATLRKRA